MDEFYIKDNFLTENEYQECMGIVENSSYHYGHSSLSDSNEYLINNEKFDNKFFAGYNLGNFNEKIKNKIETIFNKKCHVKRNYMHIQCFGQDGAYHTDDNLQNSYTFCIYFTDISNEDIENADGDFILKIPDTKHIICINTFNNRGVFFPSNYYHKGMAYNKNFSQRRLCVTWKLTDIKTDIK